MITIAPCTATYKTVSRFGATGYTYTCSCGCTGFPARDMDAARDAHHKHASIPVPPADVLARATAEPSELTYDDAHAYPHYFFDGAGRQYAEKANCIHGPRLTDSCPNCP